LKSSICTRNWHLNERTQNDGTFWKPSFYITHCVSQPDDDEDLVIAVTRILHNTKVHLFPAILFEVDRSSSFDSSIQGGRERKNEFSTLASKNPFLVLQTNCQPYYLLCTSTCHTHTHMYVHVLLGLALGSLEKLKLDQYYGIMHEPESLSSTGTLGIMQSRCPYVCWVVSAYDCYIIDNGQNTCLNPLSVAIVIAYGKLDRRCRAYRTLCSRSFKLIKKKAGVYWSMKKRQRFCSYQRTKDPLRAVCFAPSTKYMELSMREM
jgi:hypothetical protein